MDYAPVKFMIKCFEANYPESLGVVVVHKAPWIFQGIWAIIRGWLDPVVAAKVNFTKTIEELEAFVPRSRVVKDLGGGEEWEWKYPEPQMEGDHVVENQMMADVKGRDELQLEREGVVKNFERETYKWINEAAEADKELKQIEDVRHRLADQLAENYWKLDPFIRQRSVYDRVGMIGKGGKLSFYPPAVESDLPKVSTSANDLD
jgi:hypothetical protein